jgi:hypothetical protein
MQDAGHAAVVYYCKYPATQQMRQNRRLKDSGNNTNREEVRKKVEMVKEEDPFHLLEFRKEI